MNRRFLGLAALGAAGSWPALGAAGLALDTRAQAQGIVQSGSLNLLEIINASRDLRQFATFVRELRMEEEFTKPGPLGVFVPHDAAFLDASPARLRIATATPEAARRLVLNHITPFTGLILPGGHANSEGGTVDNFTSAAGQGMQLMQRSGALPSVNGLRVYVANVRASNGVAHCIDGILFP